MLLTFAAFEIKSHTLTTGESIRYAHAKPQQSSTKVLYLPGATRYLEWSTEGKVAFAKKLVDAGFEVLCPEYADRGPNQLLHVKTFDIYFQTVVEIVNAIYKNERFIGVGNSLGGHIIEGFEEAYPQTAQQMYMKILIAPMFGVIYPKICGITIPQMIANPLARINAWWSPNNVTWMKSARSAQKVIEEEQNADSKSNFMNHKDKIIDGYDAEWVVAMLKSIEERKKYQPKEKKTVIFFCLEDNSACNRATEEHFKSLKELTLFSYHTFDVDHNEILIAHGDEIIEKIDELSKKI